jgi:hypothetical protein
LVEGRLVHNFLPMKSLSYHSKFTPRREAKAIDGIAS